ncbi:hypothetical protein DK389_03840 [Methylobacterium durans]|uniref:Uncharacterized protein n=1 Tax=Methylobacterium durans TaxID=2202825 RepID=A0A2U8W189_9HYPH|nr:hypothetical protein DK389_03840 [Methylobacterium durans]
MRAHHLGLALGFLVTPARASDLIELYRCLDSRVACHRECPRWPIREMQERCFETCTDHLMQCRAWAREER